MESRIEAVSFEEINHSALNTLNLFYDFVFIDGKPYFVRQNNLLAMFFPFIASKIWYKPFEVSEDIFEKLKNKGSSRGTVGAAAVIGGISAVVFGNLPNKYSSFLHYWVVDFRELPSGVERIILTFLLLLLGFLLSFIIINSLWRILGYIIFKAQGFRRFFKQGKRTNIKLKKIEYFQIGNRRNLFVWGEWVFVPIVLLIQSFFVQNRVIYPIGDTVILVIVTSILSFIPMMIPPKKYESYDRLERK